VIMCLAPGDQAILRSTGYGRHGRQPKVVLAYASAKRRK
jgi:hypothetical protein